MSENSISFQERHQSFLASPRKHVLMITNHGIHQWRVIPGLPDTGGQNVFVNQFTAALANQGLKITIVNRGGYPHPVTGEPRTGAHYKDEHQRILYLEDGIQAFVRKEDMGAHVPALTDSLAGFLDAEGTEVHLIISHYWDGAAIGARYNKDRQKPVQHVWIPHSLGSIKKRNVPQERWQGLRIDERFAAERELVTEVDALGATSSTIQRALGEDYGSTRPVLFLPPCVDPDRYHPRQVPETDEVWGFLSQRCGLSPEVVRASKIVTEISRTDTTKRKDVLIKAFAIAHQRVPDNLLVVSIDENKGELARDLLNLIRTLSWQATWCPLRQSTCWGRRSRSFPAERILKHTVIPYGGGRARLSSSRTTCTALPALWRSSWRTKTYARGWAKRPITSPSPPSPGRTG
jgi:glycosyltransferase involved in cell wall biosynthesis